MYLYITCTRVGKRVHFINTQSKFRYNFITLQIYLFLLQVTPNFLSIQVHFCLPYFKNVRIIIFTINKCYYWTSIVKQVKHDNSKTVLLHEFAPYSQQHKELYCRRIFFRAVNGPLATRSLELLKLATLITIFVKATLLPQI